MNRKSTIRLYTIYTCIYIKVPTSINACAPSSLIESSPTKGLHSNSHFIPFSTSSEEVSCILLPAEKKERPIKIKKYNTCIKFSRPSKSIQLIWMVNCRNYLLSCIQNSDHPERESAEVKLLNQRITFIAGLFRWNSSFIKSSSVEFF